MKKNLYLTVWLLAMFVSCDVNDKYTGVWNKNFNTSLDSAAFPQWSTRGRFMTDPETISTPLFVRIKKSGSQYIMTCYQFDGATNSVVRENALFDYILLSESEKNLLVSDNSASGMTTSQPVVIRYDEQTQQITVSFKPDEEHLPDNKRRRALFKSIFQSGYHKVLDIRRKDDDPGLIDKKLKDERMIINP